MYTNHKEKKGSIDKPQSRVICMLDIEDTDIEQIMTEDLYLVSDGSELQRFIERNPRWGVETRDI